MSTGDDDDRMIEALRAVAREEDAEDRPLARLDDLASAGLDAARRAELEQEAAALGTGGAELAALLAPIGSARRGEMVAAARAAMRGATSAPAAEEGGRDAAMPDAAARSERAKGDGASWRGRPRRARTATFVAAATATLALAAGVALFVKGRGTPELPPYEVSITGGVSEMRGPGDEPRKVIPGRSVRLRLRPERAVAGEVLAAAGLEQGGRLVPLDASVQALQEGALTLQAVIPDAPEIRPGPAEIVVLVAPAGALPARIERADLVATPGRRLLRIQVVIGGP